MFDPLEVTPELNADVGTKKGEKVDYAILRDGKPILLFECKHHTTNLDAVEPTQLFRYFTVTEARFAVLTNGIVYRFYTDLDEPNKLDARHFFEINLLDLRENAIEELKKFSKPAFDTDLILATANELKYTREIRRLLAEELASPSDEFVRLFAKRAIPGRLLTQAVRDRFAEFTKRAFQHLINDRINERLKSAMAEEPALPAVNEPPAETAGQPVGLTDGGIVTTEDEIEAYRIVCAILCETVDVERVTLRDHKSYCAILLDDTNRKPICRLRFMTTRKQVGLFDQDKNEDIVPIEHLKDLYLLAPRLRSCVANYLAIGPGAGL